MSETMDGLPLTQRRWAILAQSLVVVMAVLDGSIANIALPSIATSLSVQPAESIWVVNSYQLAVTVSLIPLAALGDIYGYRRVYAWGIALFTAASLACAFSSTMPELIAARVLQGFGASGLMSVNPALMRFIFPRAQLGRGIGLTGLMVSVSGAAGPSLAAGILAISTWPSLFLINVPVGLLALALTETLPVTPRAKHRFDWSSALLNAGMFGFGIIGIAGIAHGQSHLLIGLELLVAVMVGVVFVRRQFGLSAPMLPVELFAIPAFALSVATSVSAFAAATLALVSLPFLLEAHGASTLETGLLITPWPVMAGVVAPIAGRLSDRISAGKLGGVGLCVLGVGLATLLGLPDHPVWWSVAWRVAMCGGGFALFQAPNNRLLMASTPRERSGAGSGVLSTARLLGQTLGAALVAVMFGLTMAGGVVAGANAAIAIGACVAFLAMAVSLLRLRV
jgi:DHA2 family multidrug resistance protein-like MFS transporter